jgi:hypothetical protein
MWGAIAPLASPLATPLDSSMSNYVREVSDVATID